MDNFSA
jgi:acetyl esterase/lipase